MTESALQTQKSVAQESVARESAGSGRAASLDALRGFDMFWLIGGEGLIQSLTPINHGGVVRLLNAQFAHAEWDGFTFYDLIFPLFVFMMGASLVFSMDKTLARIGRRATVMKIIKRAAILFVLGMLVNGGGAVHIASRIPLCGVLQRFAWCFLFTSLLYCFLKTRKTTGFLVAFGTILVGYWALLSFVPVPGFGQASFSVGTNWVAYVDRLMPNHRVIYGEGWLSTVPAIASSILGVFAGLLLKNASLPPKKKVMWLIGGGIAITILGYLWGLQFPVIKRIWTSSYVLVAGGYSCILLGIFYLIVDFWKLRRWAAPFVWIGMNSITAYALTNGHAANFREVAGRFVGGDVGNLLGNYAQFALATVSMSLAVGLMYFLYKKKIFIRV